MIEDEDELYVRVIRDVLRRTTGRSGYLIRPLVALLKTVTHELEISASLPADAVASRVEEILAAMSRAFDHPPQSDAGRRRIRGVVAIGARGGRPVVVTVDLSPDHGGGTTLLIRATAKELIVDRRSAEQAARAVAESVAERCAAGEAPAAALFEADPSDAAEMSAAELAFAAALRARIGDRAGGDVDGQVAGRFADGVAEPLLAYVNLIDPTQNRHLVCAGVHVLGDRVLGDRLHSQVYSLPDRPSTWALDAIGAIDQLAELSAQWFRQVLDKPIVLYVWLHDGHAFAARYAFADTGETLIQCYTRELAPPGQTEELLAAGHVHGKGWLQTVGLPSPSRYLHVRGDLTRGVVVPGVPAGTRRGPLPGFWYEGS